MINEESIKKFLNSSENKELFEQKKFDEIYEKFAFHLNIEDENQMYKFAEYLNKIGIKFLNYTNELPWGYYKGSNAKEIIIPANIKSIGIAAFSNCKKLESIILPKTVKDISLYAFEKCKNLQEINLPGIKDLGMYCFTDCTNLQKVTFSTDIKYIDGWVFEKCPKMFKIYYKGTREQWRKVKINPNNDQLFKCIIYCSDGALKFLRRSEKKKSKYNAQTTVQILWQDISSIETVKELRMNDPEYAYVWNRLQEEKKRVSPLVLEKIWKYIDEYKEINKTPVSKST